jgi:hypothetical protein
LIAAKKTNDPVAVMCRGLEVGRTGFHNCERAFCFWPDAEEPGTRFPLLPIGSRVALGLDGIGDRVRSKTPRMPEPRATTLLVSQVLTEVQERRGVDRAIGQLHP